VGLGVYYLALEAGWTPESLRQMGRLILSWVLKQDGVMHPANRDGRVHLAPLDAPARPARLP